MCILEHHCLLSAFETGSGLKVCPFGDVDALEVQVYLAFVLSLAELPHVLIPLEFCAHEALQILYADGVVRTGGMHIFHSFLKFHYPIGLLIQNTSSKLKWFSVQDSNVRILKQERVPSEQVTLCDCTRHILVPVKLAHVGVCVCVCARRNILYFSGKKMQTLYRTFKRMSDLTKRWDNTMLEGLLLGKGPHHFARKVVNLISLPSQQPKELIQSKWRWSHSQCTDKAIEFGTTPLMVLLKGHTGAAITQNVWARILITPIFKHEKKKP